MNRLRPVSPLLLSLTVLFLGSGALAQAESWQEHLAAAEAQWRYDLVDPVSPVEHLERALTLAREGGASPADVGHILDSLANAYAMAGLEGRAEAILERSLLLKQQTHGAETPLLVPTLYQLSTIRFHQKRNREGLELLRRALEIQTRAHGARSSEVVEALAMIGLVCGSLGDHREEERFLRQAVELVRTLPTATDHAVAGSLGAFADFLEKNGRGADAKALRDEASPALKRIAEKDNDEASHYAGKPRLPSDFVVPVPPPPGG